MFFIISTLCLFIFRVNLKTLGQTTVRGGGSSYSYPLYYELTKFRFPDFSFSYDTENSYIGVEELGKSIDLSGTETFFPYEDFKSVNISDPKSIICLPAFVSGLVFVYNFPDSKWYSPITLSHDLVLGIFNGSISRWDDSRIVDHNKDVPHEPIKIFFRDDRSSTTFLLKKFLSSYSKEFREEYGTGPNINMNITHGGGYIGDQRTLLRSVENTLYSFGYVSYSSFMFYQNQGIAKGVKTCTFLKSDSTGKVRVEISRDRIGGALGESIWKNISTPFPSSQLVVPMKYTVLFDVKTNEQVWPYVSFSYLCFQKNQTFETAALIYEFYKTMYDYVNNVPGDLAFIPVPDVLEGLSITILKRNMTCENGVYCFTFYSQIIEFVMRMAVIFLFFFALLGIGVILSGFCMKRDFVESYKAGKTGPFDPEINNVNLKNLVLEKHIGSGSFSEVYRGKWLGTIVAIKRFLVSKKNFEVFQEFVKETTILKKLRHPNIVQFLGSNTNDTHLYIITEYCERGNLQTIIRDEGIKLSFRKIVSFMLDSAKGMEYLHSHNPPILHRDFKSSNLLVDKNWNIKIGDFGLSRILDRKTEMSTCGTVEVCAPEVLAFQRYTEKADVYSFAIVFYESLTREELFPGLNFFEISKKVVDEKYRPDIDMIPDFPYLDDVKEIILQCWDHEPSARCTFVEIVSKLSGIYSKLDHIAKTKSPFGKKRKKFDICVADSYDKMKYYEESLGGLDENTNLISK